MNIIWKEDKTHKTFEGHVNGEHLFEIEKDNEKVNIYQMKKPLGNCITIKGDLEDAKKYILKTLIQ